MPRPCRRSGRPRSSSARPCRPGPTLSGARGGESVAASGRPSASALRRRSSSDRNPFGQPLELVRELRSDPDRSGIDRAGPPRRHHRRARCRGQGASPGHRGRVRRAIETYEWAAAHVERYGGEAERLRPRLVVAHFSNGPRASSICSAKPLRRPSFARTWSPSRATTSPRSTGGEPRAGS